MQRSIKSSAIILAVAIVLSATAAITLSATAQTDNTEPASREMPTDEEHGGTEDDNAILVNEDALLEDDGEDRGWDGPEDDDEFGPEDRSDEFEEEDRFDRDDEDEIWNEEDGDEEEAEWNDGEHWNDEDDIWDDDEEGEEDAWEDEDETENWEAESEEEQFVHASELAALAENKLATVAFAINQLRELQEPRELIRSLERMLTKCDDDAVQRILRLHLADLHGELGQQNEVVRHLESLCR